MCYFKDIKKVDNINEIQTTIIRVIVRQREVFNYADIISQIKNELKKLGVSESIVDSYRVDNMTGDALEQMIDIGNIITFNNVYMPSESTEKSVKYAFR